MRSVIMFLVLLALLNSSVDAQCDSTCLDNNSCDGPNPDECTECKSDMYLDFFSDLCLPCDDACKGCFGRGSNLCIECADGMYKSEYNHGYACLSSVGGESSFI